MTCSACYLAYTLFFLATILFTTSAHCAQSKLTTYPAPKDAPLADDYIVEVNGERIALYAATTRYGSTASFGYFDFSGTVTVELAATFAPPHGAGFSVLPGKYGIKTREINPGHIAFDLDAPAKLTFVVLGDYVGRTLHLFANDIEKDAPSPDDPNVIYFGPGYHEVGPAKGWRIDLQSNQTLYIAGGAYVKGVVSASNAENVTVRGRGVLAQDSSFGSGTSMFMTDCDGIDISGIILNRNVQGWSGLLRCSQNIRVTDYKVISPAIWSTDGLNLMNSSHVVYDDCFFRCGDDNISIKGNGASGDPFDTTEDPKTGLPNRDILIQNCIFWSDNNNAVVVGPESKAVLYEDINFRNCDILYARDDDDIKAAMSVICLNATDFRNILFEDIRVGPSGQLIDMFYTDELFRIPGNQSWPGEIDGVTFRNITATGSGSKTIRIQGWSEDKPIRNVTLDNVTIDGKKVDADSPYLKVNDNVSGLVFE